MKTSYDTNYRFNSSLELAQNKFVVKLLFIFYLVVPFFILDKISSIFPNFQLGIVLVAAIIFSTGHLVSYILIKTLPYSPAIKYSLLLTLEVAVFYLAISYDFMLYISFTFVPLLSCLYFDKKFSMKMSIISYIFMLASILVKAFFRVPYYTDSLSTGYWLVKYGVTLSIGYALNVLFVYIISVRNQRIIENDFKEIENEMASQQAITSSYVSMITQKHSGIENHLMHCAKYILIISRRLKTNKKYADFLTDDMINKIVTASYLHDIGIISIPDEILKKETPLNEDEMEILKTHTTLGNALIYENMTSMDDSFLQVLCDMSLYHHEHYDGSGYPYGISGSSIPLSASIMCAANILDNLVTDYPYKPEISFDEAIRKIKSMSGKELNPDIVEVIKKAEIELWKSYDSLKRNK